MSRLDSVARMLIASAVFKPAEQPEEEKLLPQVAAARERDRLARARVARGEDYKPSEAEELEARAWSRRGRG
jgi:hypothetical protein